MSLRNIYTAIGSLLYAIARADGTIHPEEKEIMQKLAQKEFEQTELDTEWIQNVFKSLEDRQVSQEEAYIYALDVLEANRFEYDFDSKMKKKCLDFIERTAEAFDGVSLEERILMNRVKEDFAKF